MKDQVIIITGATSGIGKATADKFADHGYKLVVSGRKKQQLDSLQKELGKKTEILTVQADLTHHNATVGIIEKSIDRFGRIDSLINSAGIIAKGTVENTRLEDWQYMFKLNVDAVFQLMQSAIPHLKESDLKSIVNVSSVVGLRQFPNVFAYSVSKAAVDQLTKVSALELADYGIRVNGINPGVIKTNLHKRGGMNKDEYEEFLEHSKSTHPLDGGRVGKPEEAADLIYFLATQTSSWITGQTIAIDGGRSLTCFR